MTTTPLATKTVLHMLKTAFEKALHGHTLSLTSAVFAQGAFIVAVLQVLQ